MKIQYVLIAVVVSLALAFTAGWKASSWHQDSIELTAQKAADKASKQFQTEQTNLAADVINSLDEWRKGNVQIQERVIHEKLQPVFSNVCVTDEYVRLFNEQTNRLSSSGSGKPATKTGN